MQATSAEPFCFDYHQQALETGSCADLDNTCIYLVGGRLVNGADLPWMQDQESAYVKSSNMRGGRIGNTVMAQ